MRPPDSCDVVIVGGGPAGLATAIAASQAGLHVVLADRAPPPIDKACGEGLMPDGVAALAMLGISLEATPHAEFRGIHFIDGALEAKACFRHGPGYGVRRPELHRLMIERAEALGVQSCWQGHVQVMASNLVAIDGYGVRCRFIVGADGLQSRLRRQLDIEPRWQGAKRLGLRQHYRIAPWSDLVEVHWHDRGQAYVTPVAQDGVCVAIIGNDGALDFTDVARFFPRLHERLRDATALDIPRGGASVSATWRHVTLDDFALVGDASGAVDAITGEGMALGFRQSLLLAEALAAGELSSYERAHRRLIARPVAMARLLLLMGRHRRLRSMVLRALRMRPGLFSRLLALHIGGASGPAATIRPAVAD